MSKHIRCVLVAIVSVLLAARMTQAQIPQGDSLQISAIRYSDHIHFSASEDVKRIGLQVFSRNGEKLLDSDLIEGNSVDWPLFSPEEGAFYYAITMEYGTGQTIKQMGKVTLRWGVAAVSAQYMESSEHPGIMIPQSNDSRKDGDKLQPTSATSGGLFQFDVYGARTGDGLPALTFHNYSTSILNTGARALMVRGCCANAGAGAVGAQFGNTADTSDNRQVILAHDGTDARLITKSGALKFTTGDFFGGADVERMRLTAGGNLGIGVPNPNSKLSVAGMIESTSGGFKFPDGTSFTTAAGLRLEPNVDSPNIIGGYSGNSVTAGAVGAAIGGGGLSGLSNRVTDDYGTVGGGRNNQAGDGGSSTSNAALATVGGGANNTASGSRATVGGGDTNVAIGDLSTVAGGQSNEAGGFASSVPGGSNNFADGSYSLAAGRRAKANHQGAFVWADSSNADFTSTANDQFLIRASGGVGIGTTSPSAMLTVAGVIQSTSGGIKFPDGTTFTTAAGLRLEAGTFPNVIGGGSDNIVTSGARGATIGGGGGDSSLANKVTDDFGTVGGGEANQAGDGMGTTLDHRFATVGGGYNNTASGSYSTLPGGRSNTAQGDYSFAAGRQAKANHQGAFVWADSTSVDFISTSNDQFLIRAAGGVGIGNNAPGYQLTVNGASGTNQDQGVAEFSNGSPDTGLRIKNTTAGGRTFALFSSGTASGLGAGNFTIFDVTNNIARLTLDAGANLSTGSSTTGGNFLQSAPNGWRDSYRIIRAGTQVASVGTDSVGTKLQLFVGSTASDSTARLTVDSSGNVNIQGNLSKGGGSFKIDHPLDPENKYLYHSFVESPEMKNIYDGNVTTDNRGVAVVTLPNYFESLNGDFRYQLTVVGRFAQAIVLREIKDNRFVIKTNRPRVKVSWQVTGVRHDAYANAHRIKVEEDKPAGERGSLLHPDAFAKPSPSQAERTPQR